MPHKRATYATREEIHSEQSGTTLEIGARIGSMSVGELREVAESLRTEIRENYVGDDGHVRDLTGSERQAMNDRLRLLDRVDDVSAARQAFDRGGGTTETAFQGLDYEGRQDSTADLPPQVRVGRTDAMRTIERFHKSERLTTRAAGDLDEMVRERDPVGLGAQYLAAVGDPAYNSAFGKMLKDPTTGHLRMSAREVEAVRRVSNVMEQRAMSEGTTTAGGFAVPFQLDPSIIHTSSGAINPLRDLCRIIPIVGTNQWKGVSADAPTASYDPEAQEVSDDSPVLAQPVINVATGRAFVPFSFELYQDWGGGVGGGIQEELTSLLQQSRDILDATKFLLGSGTNEPVGVLTIGTTGALTTTQRIQTNTSATYAVADVYKLKQAVFATVFGPNSTWVMHPTLLDSTYRFVPAASATEPSLMPDGRGGDIVGIPKREMTTLVTTTTTASKIAILGDWSGVAICDRIGSTVEFVPNLFGASGRPTGQRGLLLWWRSGTGVIAPNKLRYLEVL
jgi:HK97 family phage major capsid protein